MAAYEYDARNRLIQIWKTRNAYDTRGNRSGMTWKGKTTHYVMDDLPELSRVLIKETYIKFDNK